MDQPAYVIVLEDQKIIEIPSSFALAIWSPHQRQPQYFRVIAIATLLPLEHMRPLCLQVIQENGLEPFVNVIPYAHVIPFVHVIITPYPFVHATKYVLVITIKYASVTPYALVTITTTATITGVLTDSNQRKVLRKSMNIPNITSYCKMNQEPADRVRRAFFRDFLMKSVDTTVEVIEEFNGKPQMFMKDIDRLPDDIVRKIIPVFTEGLEYRLNLTTFCIKNDRTSDFIELLRLEIGDFDILCLFEKGLDLEQIAAQIEEDSCSTNTALYPRVKTLFLQLARNAVCHPLQSLTKEITEIQWF